MIKALAVLSVLAAVITGCVSVTSPTEQPTNAASFGVTTPAPATPAASFPTLTLPPLPTLPPLTIPPLPTLPPITIPPLPTLPPVTLPPVTAEPPTDAPPTDAPPTDAPPTDPPPTAPPTGDGDNLFSDNMDDPTSGWATFDEPFATVSYSNSALRVALNTAPAFGYGERPLGDDYATVLVAAEVVANGVDSAGLLCIGSADDGGDAAYGVVLTTSGAAIFISIIDSSINILENNPDVDVPLPDGDEQVMGLACSGTSTGALRLVVFGNSTGPLATYQSDEGPETFSAVGMYADASVAETYLDVAAAAAYAIPGSDQGMTPEADELLTHVPDLWREQCVESPRTEGETAAVVCFLQQDGSGPEIASYESYSSNAGMDAAYQDRVDDFAVEDTDSCESGPINTTWHIDNEDLGNLLCAPQHVGTRIDWTDNRLAILSSLIDFEGDYGLNYEAWQEAGPNP